MVSEIVGTALILGITVAVISTLYITVLSYPSPGDSTFVNLVGTVEGDYIIIEHRGGDALGLGTKVTLTIDNETNEFTIGEGDYLDPKTKRDKRWNVGERLVYPFEYNLSHSDAEITVIDESSNSIIMKGILDIRPGCDIGIDIMIVENPGDTPEFVITATNYRCDINTTEASIEITLPDGLVYSNPYSATHGVYDYDSGIWDIDNFPVGNSVTLKIYMQDMWGPPRCWIGIAELLSSTPMDINPVNNIAIVILE